jgi:hypothetical protein
MPGQFSKVTIYGQSYYVQSFATNDIQKSNGLALLIECSERKGFCNSLTVILILLVIFCGGDKFTCRFARVRSRVSAMN